MQFLQFLPNEPTEIVNSVKLCISGPDLHMSLCSLLTPPTSQSAVHRIQKRQGLHDITMNYYEHGQQS